MNKILDIFFAIGSFIGSILRRIWEWFDDLLILDKIIVLNTLTAFLAIVLPVAKYYIFETWFSINNPLAVYMIFIVAIMWISIFKKMKSLYIIGIISSLWYVIYIIYLMFSHGFSHAPYSLSYGIFFNIAAPLIFCGAAFLSMGRD